MTDLEARYREIGKRTGKAFMEAVMEAVMLALAEEREEIAKAIEASCLAEGGIDGELCPSHADAARIARKGTS